MYSRRTSPHLHSAVIVVNMFSLSIDNRHAYLSWLGEYSAEHQVDVLAYCLMTNHIHLVVVPTTENELNRVLTRQKGTLHLN